MNLIGTDIGTQGTKTVIFTESGECLASAFQKSKLISSEYGTIEENPDDQVDSVCNTIKECIQKSGIRPQSIAGIAIDGQMAGIIGIDKRGRHLTPYDSWLDTRCSAYIELMQKTAGSDILEKTGLYPSVAHGPKILWWKQEHDGAYRQIYSFVQPGGYAAMRLCGLQADEAFIDKTYLHFSGFADNRNNIWDKDICKTFGVDTGKLPHIRNASDQTGCITKTMAQHCGLTEGTPVFAGCGDTAASFLSVGATKPGICVDVAGTASVFSTTTDHFIADHKNHILGCGQAVIPGLWHPYAYISGGGMNIEWFLSQIVNNGDLNNTNHQLTLNDLNAALSAITPTESNPMFIPHLAGRVCPSQPHMRGAWVNLTWQHRNAHLYWAILESVAMEYKLYMSIIENLIAGFLFKEIRIIGGGSASNEWNRIKADVLNAPMVKMQNNLGAPMGAALLAGYGAGVFTDLAKAANKWNTKAQCFIPENISTKAYINRFAKYLKCLGFFNKL